MERFFKAFLSGTAPAPIDHVAPSPNRPTAATDGVKVLKDQHTNQATSYPSHSRTSRHLRGLLPPALETIDQQVARAIHRIHDLKANPLEQFMYLDRIRAEDTTLFYRIILDHLKEIVAIIYTPTVGAVCQNFSRIYTPGSVPGLFLSLSDKDHLDDILANWTYPDPEICVMTDGSRILGLGDLGINGMGIPVGKLSLYIAAAGFDPAKTLPVTLDLGTNTAEHLNDPFYLGTRTKRPDDKVFFDFTDAVMKAFKRRWPDMLVQFEDFSSEHAFDTLDRYRGNFCMFNDDIQGTGAVILSGFVNAVRLSGISLNQHRILFVGAGSAGVGVASQLMDHFIKAGNMPHDDAKNHFWLLDSKGLLTTDRADAAKYPHHKTLFARDDMGKQISTLLEAINEIRPTALIGLSSVGGTFTPEIIRAMAGLNNRPIIFPLSNPSTNAECNFADAMTHTNGTVLFASGTAFPSHAHPVTKEVIEPGQGNNMYIFPGLGRGGVLAKAVRVTDDMVYQSAITLAESLNADENQHDMLYPRLERIREISALIARDVILSALKDGLVQEGFVNTMFGTQFGNIPPESVVQDTWKKAELLEWIKQQMYDPKYPTLGFGQ